MEHFSTRYTLIAIGILVLSTGFTTCKKQSIPDPVSAASISEFETRLDDLRKRSNIPGPKATVKKILLSKNQ